MNERVVSMGPVAEMQLEHEPRQQKGAGKKDERGKQDIESGQGQEQHASQQGQQGLRNLIEAESTAAWGDAYSPL